MALLQANKQTNKQTSKQEANRSNQQRKKDIWTTLDPGMP